MKEFDFRDESILHAYVDGELDTEARRRLLARMENSGDMRDRVCELRHTKEWVKFSFEGETAPTRSLPKRGSLRWNRWGPSMFRVAASVLVAVIAFGAGWFSHNLHQNVPRKLALESIIPASQSDSRHVILHIGDADAGRFSVLLDRAERILREYHDLGVQVEVIANAGGLDMMRTASSPEAGRIKALIAKYDNVRFIACSKGLKRLRERGLDTTLLPGVSSDEPAGDHLIRRLHDGWTYIKI